MRMKLSRTEREVLERLACGERRLILDGAVLYGLARAGLTECAIDGWIITRSGREALQTASQAMPAPHLPASSLTGAFEQPVRQSEETFRTRRVLIVEDDFLVGRQLRRELEDQGAIVLGPAANDREALRIANDAAAPIDIALLDLDLNGVSAVPVAMALADRRVPTVVVTGCGALDLPPRLKDIPICHKPASIRQIAAALAVFHQP